MDNILFCSVGRRATLLKDFRLSMNSCGKIVAVDLSPVAPALFYADEAYLVPRIDAPDYYDKVLEICEKSDIKAITTLIDPEIELLASIGRICLQKVFYRYVLLIGLPVCASINMRCLSISMKKVYVQCLRIIHSRD